MPSKHQQRTERVRCRHPFDTRIRLLWNADRHGVESGSQRASLGGPDESSWVSNPANTGTARYRNLIYFKQVDKGGHFAAWEQPELFGANSMPRSDHSGRLTDHHPHRCRPQRSYI